MALTLKDIEDRGLLSELASCFDTEAVAQTLLAKLEIPAGRLRPFGSMETVQWWRHVGQQLERGLIANGLERLLDAASDIFPANQPFAEYKTTESTAVLTPRSSRGLQPGPSQPAGPVEEDSPERLRIFLSYAHEDREPAIALYERLEREGFRPWMDVEDLLPGQHWRTAIQKAIREADVFLALLSRHSSKKGFVHKEIRLGIETLEERPEADIFVIPALLEPTEVPERLRELQAVYLNEAQGFERLTKALWLLESRHKNMAEVVDSRRNLTITRIELTDIRCFKHIDLRLKQDGSVILLGDNATGKSTLLRCIALGLCNESDAVALMKEVPGAFIRRASSITPGISLLSSSPRRIRRGS